MQSKGSPALTLLMQFFLVSVIQGYASTPLPGSGIFRGVLLYTVASWSSCEGDKLGAPIPSSH